MTEITEDPGRYSSKFFGLQRLPPDVVEQISAVDKKPLPFKVLRALGTMDVEAKTGKVTMNFETQYLNEGQGGLVRSINSVLAGNIPIALTFTLNYRGVATLRRQVFNIRDGFLTPIFTAGLFLTADLSFSSIHENAVYTFEDHGTALKCHTGRFHAPRDMPREVHDRAMNLDCALTTRNGNTIEYSDIWLDQYGLVIPVMSKFPDSTIYRYHYESITAN